jgi:hypothetical protein
MSGQHKPSLDSRQVVYYLGSLSIGGGLVAYSLVLRSAVSMLLFLAGFVCMLMGLVNIVLWLQKNSKPSPVPTLGQNKTGVAWIWIAAGVSIIFCPFVYWVLGVPYSMVVETITASYTFTGVIADVFTFMRWMISYFLSFALFGILFWAVVQAKARSI